MATFRRFTERFIYVVNVVVKVTVLIEHSILILEVVSRCMHAMYCRFLSVCLKLRNNQSDFNAVFTGD